MVFRLTGDDTQIYLTKDIRYVTANQWSARRYLNMSRLGDTMQTTD